MSTTTAASPLLALTGLRFFAAMAVLVVHAVNDGIRGDAGYEVVASNAVSFFFALSGFILTYAYHDRLGKGQRLAYYTARFARIWPMHLACLLFAILVQAFVTGYVSLDSIEPKKLLVHVFLLQSWFSHPDWCLWFNGPSWSISTEATFYAVFPFLLPLVRRRPLWFVLGFLAWTVALMLVLQSLVLAGRFPESEWGYVVYTNPLFRLLDFVLGVALGSWYLASRERELPPATFFLRARDTVCELAAFALTGALLWSASERGPLHLALADDAWVIDRWCRVGGCSLLGHAATIWVLARSRGLFATFLSTKTLVYLGEVSFALYMVQFSIIRICATMRGKTTLDPALFAWTVVGSCLGVAMLLHALVEGPWRQVLVDLQQRRERAFRHLAAIPHNLRTSGLGIGVILILAGYTIPFVLQIEANVEKPLTPRTVAAPIVWAGADAVRHGPIDFEGEAVLHDVAIRLDGEHLLVTMYWEVLPTWQRTRFVHLYRSADVNGENVTQLAPESVSFRDAGPHGLVVDHCRIPIALLADRDVIGVGFYDVAHGTAVVQQGPRSMGDRRLDLVRRIGDQYELIPIR